MITDDGKGISQGVMKLVEGDSAYLFFFFKRYIETKFENLEHEFIKLRKYYLKS
jgi:hypothetical protein